MLDGFPRSLDEARALFLAANAQHASIAGADDPAAALAAVPVPPLPEHEFQPALYKVRMRARCARYIVCLDHRHQQKQNNKSIRFPQNKYRNSGQSYSHT